MKVRSDFVSNSSSSSFVLWNSSGDAKLFLEKFAEMFADAYMPWDLNDTLSVYVNTSHRWFNDVANALLDKDKAKKEIADHDKYLNDYAGGASNVDPDSIAYDNIHFPFSYLSEKYDVLLSVADKIHSLYFEAQDEYSSNDLSELRKIYSLCKDLDCCPDCSISERDFLSNDDDNIFYKKMRQLHEMKVNRNEARYDK